MSFLQELQVVAVNWQMFLIGMLITMYLSTVGMVGGVFIGVGGAYLRRSKSRTLSSLAGMYIGLFRNTPLLVQLYLYYFGLPTFGISLSAWTVAHIALVVNNGAYITEIVRGGMNGVPRTEIMAGESLGLTRLQVARHVTIPRIIRIIFPSLMNQFIIIVISSSLLGLIGVNELFLVTRSLQSETFASFGIYLSTALIYVVATLILTWLFGVVARRCLHIRVD